MVLVKAFQVDENSEQLDDGESWVCVIELDGCFCGEVFPASLPLLESPDDILKSCTDKQVLLFESEFLAS
jgi:hypothetical protein